MLDGPLEVTQVADGTLGGRIYRHGMVVGLERVRDPSHSPEENRSGNCRREGDGWGELRSRESGQDSRSGGPVVIRRRQQFAHCPCFDGHPVAFGCLSTLNTVEKY